MSRRHIHYEAAFEDYVRSRGWPYLSVDEQRKAIFAGARVKSFDYVVRPPGARGWLVDVKGRKFPYDAAGTLRFWENWVTREDLLGLQHWQSAFGNGFEPVLVFAYWLIGTSADEPCSSVHSFRGESYAFLWVAADLYRASARARSPKWNTVSVPVRRFREIARPVEFAETTLTPSTQSRPIHDSRRSQVACFESAEIGSPSFTNRDGN